MNVALEDEKPVARLLDLEKAHPRVSKPAEMVSRRGYWKQ